MTTSLASDLATADDIVDMADARAREMELVERHRHGDRAAFDEVYGEHETMVYNLALSLVGDPERAADVAQEIFLRVYRHLGKFRGRSSLKTWIFRVAVNQCRSRLARRRPWHQPLPEEEGSQTLVDPRRGPEARTLADDAGRRLRRCLSEVPEPFREAVVLRDIEGLAYDEIAEVLGVRIGTVRSRIARGRRHLKDRLESLES